MNITYQHNSTRCEIKVGNKIIARIFLTGNDNAYISFSCLNMRGYELKGITLDQAVKDAVGRIRMYLSEVIDKL